MNTTITTFEESEGDIRAIRDAVFGEEQGVPRGLDWDGNDPCCVQVVATDGEGKAIGTGRMQPDGKIGRLAVLKSRRGRGVGAKMVDALVGAARRQGLEQVHLHAQLHTVSLYENLGFVKDGEKFIEAGIRHINMTRSLK